MHMDFGQAAATDFNDDIVVDNRIFRRQLRWPTDWASRAAHLPVAPQSAYGCPDIRGLQQFDKTRSDELGLQLRMERKPVGLAAPIKCEKGVHDRTRQVCGAQGNRPSLQQTTAGCCMMAAASSGPTSWPFGS